jgi:segregation and condensation protein B
MNQQNSDGSNPDILPLLEALLFIAPGTVSTAQLATALDVSQASVDEGLKELEQIYSDNTNRRGLRLQRLHGRIQLTSAPQAAEVIEKFLGLESFTRLSRAALETLAVIAYKEPVTRPQIDAIRGVNSDGVLKNLLNKGLIQEIGRAEAPGRPILYSITPDFLQYFGLGSLDELPPLAVEEVGELEPLELNDDVNKPEIPENDQ